MATTGTMGSYTKPNERVTTPIYPDQVWAAHKEVENWPCKKCGKKITSLQARIRGHIGLDMFGISNVEKQDGSSHDRATNATPKDSRPCRMCSKFGKPQSTILCNHCDDQTTMYAADREMFMALIGGKLSTGPAAAIKRMTPIVEAIDPPAGEDHQPTAPVVEHSVDGSRIASERLGNRHDIYTRSPLYQSSLPPARATFTGATGVLVSTSSPPAEPRYDSQAPHTSTPGFSLPGQELNSSAHPHRYSIDHGAANPHFGTRGTAQPVEPTMVLGFDMVWGPRAADGKELPFIYGGAWTGGKKICKQFQETTFEPSFRTL